MKLSNQVSLNTDDIQKLSSHYLYHGRKEESWKINSVSVEAEKLNAHISMTSTYLSGTDQHSFHLTIFSALEFLSQLMIIYAHVWSGRDEKKREGWMVESTTKSVHAIRDPKNIQVKMSVHKIKERGKNLYCIADYKVSDSQGGLMEVRLKGFLS